MIVHTLETQYTGRKEFAACYLIEHQHRFVLVENNTVPCWPLVQAQMHQLGARIDNLDFHFITHIHLDHAGATGEVAKAYPKTMILGHPRALRHAVNPEKLIQSARSVYGTEAFEKLYGQISPVPANQIRELSDGEIIHWQDERIHVLHTPGHAKHHSCFHFEKAQAVFTGDTFGIYYPQLQKKGAFFIFPSTSPTDYDPEQAKLSIDRIASLGDLTFYPTHFGPMIQGKLAHARLSLFLDHSYQLCQKALNSLTTGQELAQFFSRSLLDFYAQYILSLGLVFTNEDWELLGLDLNLNGQGLAHYVENLRAKQ